MGPYKAHDRPDDEMFRFLEGVRDDLRDDGLNAFLATDVGIDLKQMDAGTQSIEFARASNAVVFVVPAAGKNLGVGIEAGAVLEDLRESAPERVLVVHEAGVRSAMLGAVADRWDAAVRSYESADELNAAVRLFARDVMRREGTGDRERP